MRSVVSALFIAALAAGPVNAEPPDEAAFERAVQALRPAAHALGLELRSGGLELAQWRAGLPLAAAAQGSVCRIGYLPWLASRRFGWLFPPLPDVQRALWLEGLVAHELAHCTQGREGAAPSGIESHSQEVAADLAFAAHVLARSPADGPSLIEQLARVRDATAARDPARDSGAALRALAACSSGAMAAGACTLHAAR